MLYFDAIMATAEAKTSGRSRAKRSAPAKAWCKALGQVKARIDQNRVTYIVNTALAGSVRSFPIKIANTGFFGSCPTERGV